ncbi:hypothetical protein [Hyalangium versicolor]|uniref:hypothetical protein n=1 Tax=Hyalangium versicolor TaxID=2861190 RepID=UPI001CCAB3FA|nr:hypothetical protein [Hyalangium versicolor]
MKLPVALGFLVFAGCATSSSQHALVVEQTSSQAGESLPADPVRLETPAGTFLVNPAHAEDFHKLLAGEPTSKPFYAADITE